jgi:hypothetical protein
MMLFLQLDRFVPSIVGRKTVRLKQEKGRASRRLWRGNSARARQVFTSDGSDFRIAVMKPARRREIIPARIVTEQSFLTDSGSLWPSDCGSWLPLRYRF